MTETTTSTPQQQNTKVNKWPKVNVKRQNIRRIEPMTNREGIQQLDKEGNPLYSALVMLSSDVLFKGEDVGGYMFNTVLYSDQVILGETGKPEIAPTYMKKDPDTGTLTEVGKKNVLIKMDPRRPLNLFHYVDDPTNPEKKIRQSLVLNGEKHDLDITEMWELAKAIKAEQQSWVVNKKNEELAADPRPKLVLNKTNCRSITPAFKNAEPMVDKNNNPLYRVSVPLDGVLYNGKTMTGYTLAVIVGEKQKDTLESGNDLIYLLNPDYALNIYRAGTETEASKFVSDIEIKGEDVKSFSDAFGAQKPPVAEFYEQDIEFGAQTKAAPAQENQNLTQQAQFLNNDVSTGVFVVDESVGVDDMLKFVEKAEEQYANWAHEETTKNTSLTGMSDAGNLKQQNETVSKVNGSAVFPSKPISLQ